MADIPINAVHRRIQYTSSGSAGPYSFAFAILDEGDLAVYDSTTLKTLTTHYTVSVSSDGTGSITFTSGNEPTSSNIVTITSDQAVARTSDFTTGGDFKAATINDELDRITIIQQQLESLVRRTPQIDVFSNRDVSDSGAGPLTFPYGSTVAAVAAQANGFIKFDALGTSLETSSTGAAQSLGGNGTVLLPYYSFSADPNSGMYRIGADNIGWSVNGVKGLDLSTTGLTVTGTLAATTITGSGVITGTTIEATGDTSSGDNSALGYTAALGAILTGQGSTNDITLVNDADATVLAIPTGTTNVDIVGVATAATFEPDGATSASDNAAIGYDSTNGITVTGQGSTNDVVLRNDAAAIALEVPTGTQNVNMLGNLVLTGDLTVNGTTVTNDATNTEIKDPLLELNSGASSNANDLGLLMERGSTGDNVFVGWDESGDYFGVGTTTATADTTGNITYSLAQARFAGLNLSGTSADLGAVTTIDINGGTVDGAVIGGAAAAAITGTTLTANTSITLATGGAMTGVLDSDAMSGTSAALLSTSESIKAYVDNSSKAAGISMTWETTTTDTDQGVGKVWANNATLSSATVLYFDDVERNGVSINALIDSLDDPTATNSATIYIQEAGSATAGVLFKCSGAVVSASTYSRVSVTHQATFGTLSDGDVVGVTFAFSGDDGAGSGDLLASNNLSDVSTAATAFTNIKQAASASATGVVEFSTDAETVTGSSSTLATTPANITAKMAAPGAIGGTTPAAIAGTQILLSTGGVGNDSAGRWIIGNSRTSVPVLTGDQPFLQVFDSSNRGICLHSDQAGSGAMGLFFKKSRNTTPADFTIVQDNDLIGQIVFVADDGVDFNSSVASIRALVQGTPGSNDTPGTLIFSTTADGAAASSQRMVLRADGAVGIGVTGPNAKLYVADTATQAAGAFYVSQNHATVRAAAVQTLSSSQTGNTFEVISSTASGSGFDLCEMISASSDVEFRVRGDGVCTSDGGFSGCGADYAEYFESATGLILPNGATVVLDGAMVRVSTATDDPSDIVGVVRSKTMSGRGPLIVGNSAWEHHKDKYVIDEYGSYILEDYDVLEWVEEVPNETRTQMKTRSRMVSADVERQVETEEEQTFTEIVMSDGVATRTNVSRMVMVPKVMAVKVFDENGDPVMVVDAKDGVLKQEVYDAPVMETVSEMVEEEYAEEVTEDEPSTPDLQHSYAEDEVPDGVVVPRSGVIKVPMQRKKLNPNFDQTLEYIPREKRDEWVMVGLLGQMRINKGQPMGGRWLKLSDISATVEEWLVR